MKGYSSHSPLEPATALRAIHAITTSYCMMRNFPPPIPLAMASDHRPTVSRSEPEPRDLLTFPGIVTASSLIFISPLLQSGG